MRSATAAAPGRRRPACTRCVEHDGIGADRLERERRDREPGVEQRRGVDRRASAARPAVTAFELMNASPSRGPRRIGPMPASRSAAPPSDRRRRPRQLALAEQRERDLGERGEVAGAERAELVRDRDEARVQRRRRARRAAPRAIPAPPAPTWLARTAIAARTISPRAARPPPAAWLRSRRSDCPSSSAPATRARRSAPRRPCSRRSSGSPRSISSRAALRGPVVAPPRRRRERHRRVPAGTSATAAGVSASPSSTTSGGRATSLADTR